jgi:hypothetical protein
MSAVTQASAVAEKIALFRSLFRGRTDVYPARFESRKTGKSGYQPACGNEWAESRGPGFVVCGRNVRTFDERVSWSPPMTRWSSG